MARNTARKVTLEANDKLTLFFKENESDKVFREIQKHFRITLKLNAIGMLVIRGEKNTTAEVEEYFNRIKSTKKNIVLDDMYSILEGRDVSEIEGGASDKSDWSRLEFRAKNGNFHTVTPKSQNQRLLIQEILNKKVIFAGGSAGAGKAQPLDAKLLTPNGWKNMGDIREGDSVIASNGKPTQVIGVYPQGRKEIYKVTFSDGASTECCEEHLWETKNEKERQYNKKGSVRNLKEISNSLKGHDGRKNHSIPLVSPVEFENSDVPIDAYTLGILLGDGCLRGFVGFTSIDKEIVNHIKKYVSKSNLKLTQSKHRNIDYRIVKKSGRYKQNNSQENELYKKIKMLGLDNKKSNDKYIPDIYKYNSIETRIAIMQGLMDSDGTVEKNKNSYNFSTSSEKLSEDMSFLVKSLGGTVNVTKKSRGYTDSFGSYKKCLDSYTVFMNLPNEISPFRLKRKSKLLKDKTKYTPKRYITNVSYVGKKQAQCIMVDDAEHLYVTDDFILTHNTFIACAVALKFLEQKLIKKIVVTRPHVASEEFGFLPGTVDEKMAPFLYPIFSIFEEIIGREKRDAYITKGQIEILPVAFSRGVTLGGQDGIITIIDECENLTVKQAYLMLTRLGHHINSKIIFAGDELQTDLKRNENVLSLLKKILKDSPYVGFIDFNSSDVVRSEIVKDILKRFEEYEAKNKKDKK